MIALTIILAVVVGISLGLLGGADLSWLFGIVVAGGVYLALGSRAAPATAPAR